MDAVRWTVDFSQDLSPIPRIEVLEEVARVYGLLGCHRKVAFFMQLRAGIMKDELARHSAASALYRKLIGMYSGGGAGGGKWGLDDAAAGGKGILAVLGGCTDPDGDFSNLEMAYAMDTAGLQDVELFACLFEDACAFFEGECGVGFVFKAVDFAAFVVVADPAFEGGVAAAGWVG